MRGVMFIELVYDKENVEGWAGARKLILPELTKRVCQILPDADAKVKIVQTNGLKSDISKCDQGKLNCMLEDMFEEANMWLVSD